MATVGFQLGVDFGTSNTVGVLRWPDGTAKPLLFDGFPLLPSAVFADSSGDLLTGRDAIHAARSRPECFEPYPKRRIDDGAVLLGQREVAVTELFGAVLARVIGEGRRTAGEEISTVTLTCPAAWGRYRRQTLLAAAGQVGVADPSLVPEPAAAASYFATMAGTRVAVGDCAMVYDFGGGTFDASLVRRERVGFEVLATEGLLDAGGVDIDAAVLSYLGAVYNGRSPEAWRRVTQPATAADRRAARLLWEDVRTGKEMLSRASATLIQLPLLDDDAPLGREQLDLLATPIVTRTLAATSAAINAAGVDPARLNAIFLVGGASRMPLVGTLLHRRFGLAPTATEQPELVVAEGSLHARTPAAMAPHTPASPLTIRLPVAVGHATVGLVAPPASSVSPAEPSWPALTRPEAPEPQTISPVPPRPLPTARRWPAFFASVPLVVLGILALTLPKPVGLVIAGALYLIIYGVFRLTQHLGRNRHLPGRAQYRLVAVIALPLAVADIVLVSVSVSYQDVIQPLLGLFWLVDGILGLVAARRVKPLPGWRIETLSGALAVGVGVTLATSTGSSALMQVQTAIHGAWLITAGVLLFAAGIRHGRRTGVAP